MKMQQYESLAKFPRDDVEDRLKIQAESTRTDDRLRIQAESAATRSATSERPERQRGRSIAQNDDVKDSLPEVKDRLRGQARSRTG